MTPPITMCVNGHNICTDCRPRLYNCPTCRQVLLGTRNVALENLARSLALPQKKRDDIPLPSAPEEEVEEPEPLQGCPMECPWTGRKERIRDHMLREHQEKLLDGTEYNNCQWKLPLIVRDMR
ncbi:hypothetical protein C0J52_26217 [Blattella germanica]|nr:hypothetical protein C0J52_26217 [Blattella germanica]